MTEIVMIVECQLSAGTGDHLGTSFSSLMFRVPPHVAASVEQVDSLKDLPPGSVTDQHHPVDGDIEEDPDAPPRMGIPIGEQDYRSIDGVIDNLKRAFLDTRNQVHRLGFARPTRVLLKPFGKPARWVQISWDTSAEA